MSNRQSDEPLPLGEILDFLRHIWAIDHGLQTLSRRMATRIGLTGPQRLVVRIVGRFPGISAGRLARTLHVHPSTLSGILRRLEERAILSRRTDPRDGRRAVLGLTALGRRLDIASTGTIEAAVTNVIEQVPDSSRQAAERVLRLLAEELDAQLRPGAGRRARRGTA